MVKCNLCPTCSLEGMQEQIPETAVLTAIRFIVNPDDARVILHLTTNAPLIEAISRHQEARRRKTALQLARVPFERLPVLVALSQCIVNKAEDNCPRQMTNDEFSSFDLPIEQAF